MLHAANICTLTIENSAVNCLFWKNQFLPAESSLRNDLINEGSLEGKIGRRKELFVPLFFRKQTIIRGGVRDTCNVLPAEHRDSGAGGARVQGGIP